MYASFREIIAEQKKPLEYKIEKAKSAIRAGYGVYQSKAAIAFSGGKDSTVLWHLIRTHFPEHQANTAVIFGNTGVEYPESLKFAQKLGTEWGGENFFEVKPELLEKDGLKYAAQVQVLEYIVETGQVGKILKADGKLKNTEALEKACPPEMWERFRQEKLIWPKGTPKSYWWCCDQYGYPILGKAASKLKARRINIDCFLRFSNTASDNEDLKRYYDLLRKVKISQGCCDILKKKPSHKLQRAMRCDLVFLGMMASESHRRRLIFSAKGYLFEVVTESRKINIPAYQCHPLAIWTDADIWEYIRRYNVPYSPLYDLTYKDTDGNTCKMKRNGCLGCFTDYGRKNNHMYVLRQTHPAAWKAVMKFGMASEIQKLRTTGEKKYAKPTLLDIFGEYDAETYAKQIAWAIENRPCAFV